MKRSSGLWIIGILIAFVSGFATCMLGNSLFHGDYVTTEDIDLDADYAFGEDTPITGTLRAGSEVTVTMRKGNACYVRLITVLDRSNFEDSTRPVD